jgi:hypothetical protein
MKLKLTGLLFLILICCKREVTPNPDFELIDLSIYTGWRDFYCLKVTNDGKAFAYNNRHRKGETYYTMTLSKIEVDSISKFIKPILNSSIDTLYESSCVDCGCFNLIIKTKDQKFRSFVNGIDTDNKDVDCMNHLVYFLFQIAHKYRNTIDSVFVFESKTKYFYPPPPPPAFTDHDLDLAASDSSVLSID